MFARIHGKQLHYDILGAGSPILLVHGWGGSIESLRGLGNLLALTHRVILVDLPGFGSSENPEPDWGVEEYVQVLSGLMDELKIKKTSYFGHSFGGSLGIVLATRRPKLIQHLFLCNSALKRPNKTVQIPLFLKGVLFRQKHLRIWLYRIFFPNSDIAKQPHLETNFKKIMQQDVSEYAPQISVPTHIIWGAGDTVTPVAWANELHQTIKQSTLAIIPNARHGLPLRDPESVAHEMQKYL